MPLFVRCRLYSIGHAGLSPAFLLDFRANRHVVKWCQDRCPLKFNAVMKLYASFEYINRFKNKYCKYVIFCRVLPLKMCSSHSAWLNHSHNVIPLNLPLHQWVGWNYTLVQPIGHDKRCINKIALYLSTIFMSGGKCVKMIVDLLTIMLSRMIVTQSSRSGRVCSCQNPT